MNQTTRLDNRQLLELLLAEEGVERTATAEIRRDDSTPPPMSRAQRRLWFLQQAAPHSPAYNVLSAVQLSGQLNVAAFQQALNEIVRRHDVLRTCFPSVEDRPSVHVLPDLTLRPALFDLRGFVNDQQRTQEVRGHMLAESSQPFDLNRGPLLRVRLLQLAERQHVAILVMHHIVTDAWSMNVFVGEFSKLYADFSAGKPSSLGELEIQYSDFARWQEQWLSEPESANQLAWWKNHLDGVTQLEIPTDRTRSAEPTMQGGTHAFAIPMQVTEAVKTLARQEGATLFMTLLAAFNVLLHRYCQQDEIVVGTPIANRNRRELEPLIGFFVNSLVMRSDLSGLPSFRELLRRVRDFAIEAYAHQDVPFDVLVNEIAPKRHSTHNPLFQVMFTLENAPAVGLNLPELTIAPLQVDSNLAKFDLLLNISDTSDGLVGAFEYSVELFDKETIARMSDHFERLLSSIVADPDKSVAKLPLLTNEQQQLLVDWNNNRTDYPRGMSIHSLFERQAEQFPLALALEFGPLRMNYAQLNARANQLAHLLKTRGVGLGSAVAIHMQRSADMIVGMLAILKAGGFYVPLDTEYPPQRLAVMLDDCHATVLLTHTDLFGNLPQRDVDVICLDTATAALAREPGDNLDASQVDGEHLAYGIYTSGSTGVPKGVTIPHRAVIRLVRDTNYIQLKPDDRIAQASNASFDAATFEIWGALLNGAQLVGVERETILSPGDFAAFLKQHRITSLFLTTALFNQMAREVPTAFGHMRHVLFGGELVDPQWVRAVVHGAPPKRLLHVYGPTENTTFSTWYRVDDVPLEATTVPIGRAISNTELYVLDSLQQLVPIGVYGELYLGGEGLAQGYLNRAELTDDRFVDHPFDEGRCKLYRTGDQVRWLPSGDLEFRGRRDSQVKIRGFRIELGEIESALLRHPQVRQAVVLAREDQPGHRELVAYVAGTSLGAAILRDALAAQLPGYMVPAKYVLLDELPLNENGKVDRKILPPPDSAQSDTNGEADLPRNELERCLVNVWQEALHCARVGIHDNYFELGGDSITAIQLVSRLKRAGWQIKVAELFWHPTIAELAPCLKPDQATAENIEGVGEIPLTAVQRWFFEHYHGQRQHFNQAVLLRAIEPLDELRLRQSLAKLQAQHDALRLTFDDRDDTPIQLCVPSGDSNVLEVIDLCGAGDVMAALERHASHIQRGIDLQHGPLLRSALFRCPDGDRLLLVIHHLAVDGVSWRIVLEDLQLAYRNQDLGGTTSSFRAWAEHVQRIATNAELGAELDYWLTVEQANTSLPMDVSGTTNRHGDAQSIHEHLSAEETAWLLTQAHRAYQTEIMDLLMTALGRALNRWTGSAETLITLEGHGRELTDDSLDLNRTVGWFTSIYPFVVSVSGSDVGSQILRVKEDLRRIPNKGTGYGILRYVAGKPLTTNPQISFNYLGKFDHAGAHDGLFEFSDESSGKNIAEEMDRAHQLDFVCIVGHGQLALSLEFNPQCLPTETATELLADFKRQLQGLIEHTRQLVELSGKTSTALSSNELADNLKEIAARIVSGAIDDVYPLSPMQAGLLFQSLFEPDDDAYFVQSTHRIKGPLRADVFQECWRILAERHAVLRSAFVHEGLEQPLQVVLKNRPPEIQFIDLRGLSTAEADRKIELFRAVEQKRGFDLQREVLMRVALFWREEDVHDLVWSHHHIVLDGWCIGILYRDLMEAYRTLSSGVELVLPPVPPLRRYVDWLQRRDQEQDRRFWSDYTAGYEQTATLPKWPIDTTASERREKQVTLDADLTQALKQLAARSGVTLNTAVQCLWGLLLFHYNNVNDVIFGAVVSGRPSELEGVEEMLGVFINAIPVRIHCAEGQTFIDLLKSVQRSALEAQLHCYLPLAEIQSTSSLGRGLFDHLLVFENQPRAFHEQDDGSDRMRLDVELIDVHDYTHYDLTVTIDVGASLEFRIVYRSNIYTSEQIDRLAAHLATAARNVVQSPGQKALDVSILPDDETIEVVRRYNATTQPLPAGHTVVDLFEQQADRTPDAIALAGEHGQTTYARLDAWSNHVAHWLREKGVKENDRVGILLPRDARLVAAILGVLKAGAAYVPLDPEHPASRTQIIVDDSRCRLVLTPNDIGDGTGCASAKRLELAKPQNLAYVIYTSGSTGRPKGCQIEHGSLLNYLMWANRYYFADDSQGSFGLFTSMSFDMTVTSFYLPLIRGRTLHLFSQQADIAEVLAQNLSSETPIDCLKLTPSHISLIGQLDVEATNVGLTIVGGEALQPEQLAILRRLNPAMRIYNEYGPTEATVGCICKEIATDNSRITIGRPIDNTQIYILDHRLAPVPIGATGEIFIAGKCLARGYFDRDDLNHRAFIELDNLPYKTNSECDESAATIDRCRAYKSGDLGRWLPSGDIEYLGRNDGQVKVRGFRIELGEVEACLVEHPAIDQAAVLCRPAAGGGSELVAYVSTEAGVDVRRLREWLAQRLPEPMVPSFFVTMASLPLALSGKINRSALAEVAGTETVRTAHFRSASNELEKTLVKIWQAILQFDPIGMDDNFFELGGHSLKAMQVVSQVGKRLGARIRIRDVFEQPTVGDLATVVAQAPRSGWSAIPVAPPQQRYKLSHAQERLWLLHHMRGAAAYNMPASFAFDRKIDLEALQKAFDTLISRHETLRTAFLLDDGEPCQEIRPDIPFSVNEIDLRGSSDADRRAREIVDAMANKPFDLDRPPLLRAAVIRLADEHSVFAFTMHHIIGDGWSLVVLYQELLTLYEAYGAVEPDPRADPLMPLRIQYKDFATWQNGRDFQHERKYWRERLAGVPEKIQLPYDFSSPSTRDFRGEAKAAVWDGDVVAGLRATARRKSTTLSNVVLSLFNLFLYQWTRQDDLCIGMSIANRSHPDLENLIGFFVNILPIRCRLSDEFDFDDLLDQVIERTYEAFEQQDYPFDLLVRELNPVRYTNRQPLVNVIYSFQNYADIHIGEPKRKQAVANQQSTSWTPFEFTFATSKFDLTLFVVEDEDRLLLTMEFDSNLFQSATMEHHLGSLRRFAEMICILPSQVTS